MISSNRDFLQEFSEFFYSFFYLISWKQNFLAFPQIFFRIFLNFVEFFLQ